MAAETAARPPLSTVQTFSPAEDDAAAERWRQWQFRNAASSRAGAKRTRSAFIVLCAGLGVWLGLQFLAPSLWP